MEIREELRYSEDHEWVLIDGDVAVVGITDYAQSELGDLVFVNLPEVNEAPYDAWFIKVSDFEEADDLMSADEYKTYLEGLE